MKPPSSLFTTDSPGLSPHATDKENEPADRFRDYFRLFTDISKQIHTNTEVADILSCIVSHSAELLRAKGAIFWILNTNSRTIETKISHGFDFRSLSLVDYPTLVTLFDPDSSTPIVITDARNDPRIPDLERLGKHLINAITGLYVDITGSFKGLLAVYFTASRTLSENEIELLTALSEQGAIALEKALVYDEQMLSMYGQIIKGFALAIEARDPATHGHSQTVARLAKAMAEQLGLPHEEIDRIYHAASLHDIGKIGTRDQTLNRLGKLNARQMEEIRKHPVLGADILAPLTFLGDISPLIRAHHELFDGTGYPEGIKGEDIPLGARIITVCDTFETMISGRAKMGKLDLTSALGQLKSGSGNRFDPGVVTAFFEMIQTRKKILDTRESIDECMENLTRDMKRLAKLNRIEKKLPNPFTGLF